MGVLFKCGAFDYSCSYGNWSKVRMGLFHATMTYLEKKQEELIQILQHDKTMIDELVTIDDLISKFEDCNDVDQINEIFETCRPCIDRFIRFGVYGLYALTNKNDDQGYYSVGNSVDIFNMICLVEEFVSNENDKYMKDRIKSVKRLFETSITTKTMITIM